MPRKSVNKFASQRDILNFRPNIHFVEPPQVEEVTPQSTVSAPSTLDTVKNDVSALISQYNDIENTANAVQAQIDQKAANVTVKLDPIQDSLAIQALRRHFNDQTLNTITYYHYITCLKELNAAGQQQAVNVDPLAVQAASSDQYRDSFGGLGAAPGLNRPELSTDSQMVPPLDLNQFKSEQLTELFTLLEQPISDLIIKKIKQAASSF